MNKCWVPVLESIFKFNAVIKAGLRKKFPPLLSTPNGMMVRLLLAGIFVAQLIVSPAQAEQILFTPENGLSGSSHGEGSIKLFFGQPRTFHVRSFGQNDSDGSFLLNQTIVYDGKESQNRLWSIQQTALLHYSGTLSDAAGMVTGYTSEQHLILKYRIKGPLVMHQTLVLLQDGKTIDNVGQITLLGIPVGFMHETIRRED